MSELDVFQFPAISENGTFLGRVQLPDRPYPSIATVRGGIVYEITSPVGPTVRDVAELDDPAAYVRSQSGSPVGPVDETPSDSRGEPIASLRLAAESGAR